MLGKTSVSAIRALLFLAQQQEDGWWSPRRLAAELGESPTYLAKILRQLARAGILEVARGVHGGVRLARPPKQVTLLETIEACQGPIVGDYCRAQRDSADVCGFHQAAQELQAAMVRVLGRWTLARLLARPEAARGRRGAIPCLMQGVSLAGCAAGCRFGPSAGDRP